MIRVVAALLVCVPAVVSAQGHIPLEITYPTTGLHAASRPFRAHPNVAYNIPVGVIGGTEPYTYSLTGAPSWMSIKATSGAGESCSRAVARAMTAAGTPTTWAGCGYITGTPTNTTSDDDSDWRVCVTDATSTQVCTGALAVDVTTTGFVFVSSSGNDSNSGAFASPLQTMSATHNVAKVDAETIVYYRAGTYTVGCAGGTESSGEDIRCEWNALDGRPTIWLAYPGETVILDFGGDTDTTTTAPRIRPTSPYIFIDGFDLRNCEVMCFQYDIRGEGPVFRRNTMTSSAGRRFKNGVNSAFLMTIGGQDPDLLHPVIEGNDFGAYTMDSGSPAGAHVKLYSTLEPLIENNLFHDAADEALALKESVGVGTVRYNSFYANAGHSIGGNWACNSGTHCTTLYIAYNDVLSAGTCAICMNQQGETGAVKIYRNTIRGTLLAYATTAGEGPFDFAANVVVNGQGGNTPAYITTSGSVTASRYTSTNDLRGAASDGLVDANGLLQGSYRSTYLGTRGFEFDQVTPGTSAVYRYRFRAD